MADRIAIVMKVPRVEQYISTMWGFHQSQYEEILNRGNQGEISNLSTTPLIHSTPLFPFYQSSSSSSLSPSAAISLDAHSLSAHKKRLMMSSSSWPSTKPTHFTFSHLVMFGWRAQWQQWYTAVQDLLLTTHYREDVVGCIWVLRQLHLVHYRDLWLHSVTFGRFKYAACGMLTALMTGKTFQTCLETNTLSGI